MEPDNEQINSEIYVYVYQKGERRSVAKLPQMGDGRANARLIAAATTAPHECDDPTCSGAINKRKLDAFPELLEACKAAKQAIANAISFVNDEASPTASTEISALFAQLYAAIAKATE